MSGFSDRPGEDTRQDIADDPAENSTAGAVVRDVEEEAVPSTCNDAQDSEDWNGVLHDGDGSWTCAQNT